MRRLVSNRLFAAFLCLTLMFKVLVPVGFMPDFEAMRQGIYKVTICSGMAHHAMLDDESQQPSGDMSHGGGHKTEKPGNDYCPFAGMHASALALTSIFLAVLLLVWRRLRFAPTCGAFQPKTLPAAWPRGPPLILA